MSYDYQGLTIHEFMDGSESLTAAENVALAEGKNFKTLADRVIAANAQQTADKNNLQSQITAEVTARQGGDGALQGQINIAHQRIDGMEMLGHYVGSFATKAALPTNISSFPNGITVNDFTTVRADETNGNAPCRYVVQSINDSGVIAWKFDLQYSVDVSGKADNLQNNGTPPANLNIIGTNATLAVQIWIAMFTSRINGLINAVVNGLSKGAAGTLNVSDGQGTWDGDTGWTAEDKAFSDSSNIDNRYYSTLKNYQPIGRGGKRISLGVGEMKVSSSYAGVGSSSSTGGSSASVTPSAITVESHTKSNSTQVTKSNTCIIGNDQIALHSDITDNDAVLTTTSLTFGVDNFDPNLSVEFPKDAMQNKAFALATYDFDNVTQRGGFYRTLPNAVIGTYPPNWSNAWPGYVWIHKTGNTTYIQKVLQFANNDYHEWVRLLASDGFRNWKQIY